MFRDYAERAAPNLRLQTQMAPFSWDGAALGQRSSCGSPSVSRRSSSHSTSYAVERLQWRSGPGRRLHLHAAVGVVRGEGGLGGRRSRSVPVAVIGGIPAGEQMTYSPKIDVVPFTGRTGSTAS